MEGSTEEEEEKGILLNRNNSDRLSKLRFAQCLAVDKTIASFKTQKAVSKLSDLDVKQKKKAQQICKAVLEELRRQMMEGANANLEKQELQKKLPMLETLDIEYSVNRGYPNVARTYFELIQREKIALKELEQIEQQILEEILGDSIDIVQDTDE